MSDLVLSVTPADGMIDIARQIIIGGLEPGELVSLSATTIRAGGAVWESRAMFLATADGTVDLVRDAPVGGDYAEISAMGLIWSQQPADAAAQNPFPDDVMQPLVTQLVAQTQAGRSVKAELRQRFAAAGVSRRELREDGLVGTVFTPGGEGPHPVVVVLNGSGGGINEARGALYASHGYTALSLGYFKAPGLSRYITATPLEYLEKGLQWAHENLAPAGRFVAVSGQSRGGELSLLLASRFPDLVSAVIAYVPGAMVHGAQGAADPDRGGWNGPAWTWKGEPLAHLWDNNSAVHWHPWDGDAPPDRHHNVFFEGLRDRETVAKSRIPAENIVASVALVSGLDDRAWPSSLYSRMIVSEMVAAGRGDRVIHLDYDNAGHSINFPWLPTTQIVKVHPVSGVPFTSGGNASGNARADALSWQGVLDFLARHRHGQRQIS